MPSDNFVQLLLELSEKRPQAIAIRFLIDGGSNEVVLTYRQLGERVLDLAAYLQTSVGAGERALLLLPTGLDYAVAFFGCLAAGVIAVPAYPPQSARKHHQERLLSILEDAKPRLVLTDRSTRPSISTIEAAHPTCRVVALDEIVAGIGNDWRMPLIAPETLAFLQYTSGSTGSPKGVRITHGNLIANERAIKGGFGIGPDDIVVSWLPLYHDMGLIGGLLQPIFSGVPLVLLSPQHFLERPARWLDAISRYGGTVSGGPDFAYRLCAERIVASAIERLSLATWQVAFCGAEVVRGDTLRAFSERFRPAGFQERAFYPCYGLAEATLFVTGGMRGEGARLEHFDPETLAGNGGRIVAKGTEFVASGRIAEGHALRVAAADDGTAVATTGVGEIWIAGPSIADGYWNNATATAEDFVCRDGNTYLRTGDLGFLQAGQLFVTGRSKDVIIVRGQNIYPHDVERIVEANVPALRKGRVAAFPIDTEDGEQIGIAAEIGRIARKAVSNQDLARAINQTLTETFQQRARLVLLLNPGGLPRTSSGKLQRTACLPRWRNGNLDVLAAFDSEALTVMDTPGFLATETEEIVAEVWGAVLGRKISSAGGDFFALGGTSLTAAQALARLRERYHAGLELRLFFDFPTLGNFAAEVDRRCAGGTSLVERIRPVFRSETHALSAGQSRLWFLWQLDPNSAAYNLPGLVRLRGTLDEVALARAIDGVVARHESLRTTVEVANDGAVAQRVHAPGEVALTRIDLTGMMASERESAAARLAEDEAQQPFDLIGGPLLRVSLLRLDENDHLLLMTMHHIIADGWSVGILVDEVSRLYRGEMNLPPLPIHYADYAAWQRCWLESAESDRHLAYWRSQLGTEHSVLALPITRQRSAMPSHRGTVHRVSIGEELTGRLRLLAKDRRATLFMVLLPAFKALLFRYTGQSDIRVGVPVANRDRVETEGLIGFFVNTLVLRTEVRGRDSFVDLLAAVRETLLDGQAHQEMPFERLVETLNPERSLGHNPLFQVMVSYQRGDEMRLSPRLPGLSVEVAAQATGATQFDLSLELVEADKDIAGTFTYATDLFDAATIERLAAHWLTLLADAVTHPARALDDLAMLSEAERGQIDRWSRGEVVTIEDRCVHERIAAQAARSPERLAVISEEAPLSYCALNATANKLAHWLRTLGVGPDVLVGIAVERSPAMVVGLLAILKAGGAYLPLDPEYPRERLAYMIADSGVALVLTQEHLLATLPATQARLWCLDRDWREVEPYSEHDPDNLTHLENLAYCIYTSGSTGQPKGAGNTHGALVNRLEWMQRNYKLIAADRVLQKTPFAFDVSVWEFFWPLLAGAGLVMAPPGAHRDAERLAAVIRRQAVTTLHFVPSMLQAFLATTELATCDTLRHVMCSGEVLPLEAQQEFHRQNGAKLHNLYGPTEAAIDVTWWECRQEEAATSVPIGSPIANLLVRILDPALTEVPVGIVGELYLGGMGLARGYLKRPGLTAERFVPDPFGEPGSRLYRTGDLGRWRSDGSIEYVGRIDHQVKLRGFRIELGEIEARLLSHEDVREAVVVLREMPRGKQLVGYVTGVDDGSLEARLRAHLSALLPDYMVPSRLVVLDRLPLTANGKLDRRALPEPGGSDEGYVAPCTEPERQLTAIWQEVLGIARIGITDNFFALGGDSLLSLKVVARARQAGWKIAPKELFERQTVAALSASLSRQSDLSPIPRVERDRALPLSHAQTRLWFMWRLSPESAGYNMPGGVRLRGRLDEGALRRALDGVAARHESLRTTFAATADGGAVQRIHAPAPVALGRIDLTALPPAERDAAAGRLAEEEARRPFDLEKGPLLRASVVRLGEEDHLLLVTMHHIVSDAWSVGLLIDEFVRGYGGDTAVLPLPIQYADYAVWQRAWLEGGEGDRQLAYWRARLGSEHPVLPLPTDRRRSAAPSGRGAVHAVALGPGLTRRLRALAQDRRATLFMVALAGFKALLFRYTGQSEIRVGVPVANRNRIETEGLIGFFVNTLVLRSEVRGRTSFADLVVAVRETVLAGQAHQDLPFERLVEALNPERSLSHNPLFQVIVNHQRGDEVQRLRRLPGLSVEPIALAKGTTEFDLSLDLIEGEEELVARFGYATDLFDAATIERLAVHWRRLLEDAAEHPMRAVADLALLGAAERAQIESWSGGEAVPVESQCLHELVAAQAARRPEAIAVVYEDQQLSYRELNAGANRLAHRLRALGVGPDVLVGIAVERSLAMVVGLLAILKAGGAYVPLDPEYPAERLAFMIADSGVDLVLTQEHLLPTLPGTRARRWCLDRDWAEVEAYPDSEPGNLNHPHNLAYCIYTSGSTGRPKGALLAHRNVLRLLDATDPWFRFDERDVWTLFHSYAFDFSVWELFGALTRGGRVVVVPYAVSRSPEEFFDLLRKEGVTVLNQTPSAFRQLMQVERLYSSDEPLALRTVIFGGEALDIGSLERWFRYFGDEQPRLINMYGITETTVHVSYRPLQRRDLEHPDTSPIGKVIPDLSWYLFDQELSPVPVGVVGELHIGGAGLARGYLGRPGLTAERFVPDPFGKAGSRLYRTGDLARRRADGSIEYVGRLDHQVKVRGFRIELGEIEARLLSHAAVREAVVVARETSSGKQLVGYVTGQDAGTLEERLRAHLSASLPDYMVPSRLVVLDRLPLTANGKLDRNALPEPGWSGKEHVPPRNEIERQLAAIWQAVLGVPRIGVTDNFFELGGDSIIALQVVSRARGAGLRITPREMFQHQTIEGLARVARLEESVAVDQGPVAGPVALTPIQAWFFAEAIPARDHWNQSVLLRLRPAVTAAALRGALADVVAHHDALRLRYRREGESWVQHHAAAEEAGLLWVREAEGAAAIERLCEAAQRSLDLTQGPLLRGLLIRLADGSERLLLAIHHLAVDGVSWRVLLEDLRSAYEARAAGRVAALPAKTSSFQAWSARLQDYAASATVKAEIAYWRSQLDPAGMRELPQDDASGSLLVREQARATSGLDRQRTTRLLGEAGAAYRTRIDELLLTALARVLCRWSGSGSVLVEVEGHGREDVFEGLDLSRTVGWFTNLYPVRLTPREAIGASIKAVKEQLRSVPGRGLGYGVLSYLAGETFDGLARPRITFNYLGQFDRSFGADGLFVPAAEPSGSARDPAGPLGNWLAIDGQVYDGALRLEWSYSRAMYRTETIARLAADYEAELAALIAHCLAADAGGLTPSDVALSRLGQAQLDALPVPAREIADIYPLSPMQHGMLFHALHSPEDHVYVDQLSVEIEGLDASRLRAAWEAVLSRHEALRSCFLWEGDVPSPLQLVRKTVSPLVTELDWRARQATARMLEELAAQERARGFDLATAPLQRVLLVRLAEARHRLIWTHHHLVSDGWSAARQLSEVLRHYRGETLPPVTGRYRDYIGWLQAQDQEATERFWQERLRQLEEPTLLADAVGRRSEESGYGESRCLLSVEETRRLQVFAQAQRVTLNTLVQGAWLVLLQGCCGQSVVCFGATVAGRPAGLAGAEEMLGLFINTLPVIATPSPAAKLGDWLRSLQDDNLALRDYEHAPLYEIQRWAGRAGQALFDSILVFENYPVDQALKEDSGALRFGAVSGIETTNYPMTLTIVLRDRLEITYGYWRNRFGAEPVARLQDHLRHLLAQLPEDAERRLGALTLPTAPERAQLEVWSRGETMLLDARCLHELIAAQAARTPEAIAVIHEDQPLSYRALNARANQLAHRLRALGVGPDVLVGIAAERSPAMVVGLLAILKAGGAYLPLDPEYPRERLAFMIADSGVALVLTQEHLLASLPQTHAMLWCLDRDWPEVEAFPDTDPDNLAHPLNLAYCIYTSGSTGQPKAVAIFHASVINFLGSMAVEPGIVATDRVLGLTSLSFDIAGLELLLPLTHGASIVLVDSKTARDAERLSDRILDTAVTMMQATPSSWRMLLESGRRDIFAQVKPLCGGEALPADLADELVTSSGRVWNLYGPTETTIWSGLHLLTESSADPVLGRPIGNTQIYLLDPTLSPVPIGVVGELYIGGAGLARGYLKRPGLTAERFVPDPFGEPGARLYRTGDLGRWRSDGAIEYVGRIDHQVKLRGFRIELGEIEARLLSHEDVREAVVVARETPQGKQLVGYVTGEDEAGLEERLRAHLSASLPDYMVPSRLLVLDRLPLTANGKLDRRALPESGWAGKLYVAPRTALERQLAEIWQAVLGVPTIGVTDDFFELGGDSISSVTLVAALRRAGIGNITVADIFHRSTIERLSAGAMAAHDGKPSFAVPLRTGHDRPPIYCLPTFFGRVGGYVPLANSFAVGQPVIGFQARWLTDFWTLDQSIEEIASAYTDYIIKYNDAETCTLLGWSWGGVLAYEVARQLPPQVRVNFIGMVDIHDLSEEFDRFNKHVDEADRRALEAAFTGWIAQSSLRRLWEALIAKATDYERNVALNYFMARRPLWGDAELTVESSEYTDIVLLNTIVITRRYRFVPQDVPIKSWIAAASRDAGRGLIDWTKYSKSAETTILDDVTHDTIIVSPLLFRSIMACLESEHR